MSGNELDAFHDVIDIGENLEIDDGDDDDEDDEDFHVDGDGCDDQENDDHRIFDIVDVMLKNVIRTAMWWRCWDDADGERDDGSDVHGMDDSDDEDERRHVVGYGTCFADADEDHDGSIHITQSLDYRGLKNVTSLPLQCPGVIASSIRQNSVNYEKSQQPQELSSNTASVLWVVKLPLNPKKKTFNPKPGPSRPPAGHLGSTGASVLREARLRFSGV